MGITGETRNEHRILMGNLYLKEYKVARRITIYIDRRDREDEDRR
jgi:hypothetical protein